MTSWSFLYDAMSEQKHDEITLTSNISEATEKDYSDFWQEDGISLSADIITYKGNPFAETMCLGADTVSTFDLYGDYGEDHISFDFDMTTSNNPNRFKYNEERILLRS